jgi:DNA polymerase-3 subunit beta
MAKTAVKTNEEQAFKISIERSKFLKSLSKLQSIVEKRNTIPILSNVKLDAVEGALQLTVTDMDLVATEEIEANVEFGGSLTVPAITLYDIIRKLPEGSEITLESNPTTNQIIVTSGTSRFSLSFLPSDDFPVMSEGTLTHNFTLAASDFLTLMEKTKFAMSNEETRYYLNGVYLHFIEGKLRAVATDGHRLARVEIESPAGAEGMPGIIIPRKAVNEISKLLESQKEVSIALSESKIKFVAGKTELLSKLVDGTFPDYQRVIPSNNTKFMSVGTQSFTQAVDRVATITADKTRGIKLALSTGNLTLNSTGAEGSSAKEDLPVEYNSDTIEVGFNSRYVLEMMGQIESQNANFAFDSSSAPVIVTDASNPGALYIVMPMRV